MLKLLNACGALRFLSELEVEVALLPLSSTVSMNFKPLVTPAIPDTRQHDTTQIDNDPRSPQWQEILHKLHQNGSIIFRHSIALLLLPRCKLTPPGQAQSPTQALYRTPTNGAAKRRSSLQTTTPRHGSTPRSWQSRIRKNSRRKHNPLRHHHRTARNPRTLLRATPRADRTDGIANL